MSIIRVAGFLGANIALQPMLLPETVGVSSLNSKPGRGDLRPWKAPLNVATVPAGRQTIHRMGRLAGPPVAPQHPHPGQPGDPFRADRRRAGQKIQA